MTEITAGTVLPARREDVTLVTADGLTLVGELAQPADRPPLATLICLHPLPTHGGMMDSHVLRKAAYRLPALADLAVFRFNTRGTASDRGRSEGDFGDGTTERHDVAAAIGFCADADLPRLWLLGWSFGTELALQWGNDPDVEGAAPTMPHSIPGPPQGSRWWRLCPSLTTTYGLRRPAAASAACRRPR
jgi:hypothetical protein